jgi:hypothetical protein
MLRASPSLDRVSVLTGIRDREREENWMGHTGSLCWSSGPYCAALKRPSSFFHFFCSSVAAAQWSLVSAGFMFAGTSCSFICFILYTNCYRDSVISCTKLWCWTLTCCKPTHLHFAKFAPHVSFSVFQCKEHRNSDLQTAWGGLLACSAQ